MDENEEGLDGDVNTKKNSSSKISGYCGKSTDYVATGLNNLRNTCYMNAVIQCLAGTEQMRKIMSDNSVIAPEGSIYNELKLLITAITSGVYERIIPLKLKERIDKYLGDYRGHRQHDAHDFMCSLLEQIDKEVNPEEDKEVNQKNDKFLKIFTGTTEVKKNSVKTV